MKKVFRLGTRRSPLALTQSNWVKEQLEKYHEEIQVELVEIITTGDRLQKENAKPEDLTKAVFTKEIETALLDNKIDLAVHSCKDLAADLPPGLILAAVPERVSPRDVLILKKDKKIEELQKGDVILTGSARRRLQWLEKHPLTTVEPVRGNIDTRIRKLREHSEWEGLLLAEAGLLRLKPDCEGLQVIPLEVWDLIPAPGQAALAIECRRDDRETREILKAVNHSVSFSQIQCERAFLKGMDAGCDAPLGAYASLNEEGNLRLDAIYYESEEEEPKRDFLEAEIKKAEALGKALAYRFRKQV